MRDELTTGEFARAAGLTRKALRLYDELGLLRAARTDPQTGYRCYASDQLHHARRIAWLRRVGMPLTRIRECAELPARELAHAVRLWWATEEQASRHREALVATLVDALDTEDDMTITFDHELYLDCAAATAQGPVRVAQLDAADGGERFAAVADGFGPVGDRVSGRIVQAVADLATDNPAALLAELDEAVRRAADGEPTPEPESAESGSTVTAIVLAGDRLALVHVGDSRAYLLRGDVVSRLTHDHTLVRSMVEAGTLTEAEAASHPQRDTLLRAAAPGQDGPDLALHTLRTGDRYLLATDGLHTTLAPEAVVAVLRTRTDPVDAARTLIDLALAAGAPDNVAVAVADVRERPTP